MIEILHYETANKNKTIGYVDIAIPYKKNCRLFIRHIPHIQSNGRTWFNLPTFPREKGDGKPEYLCYVELEVNVYNAQLIEKLPQLVKDYCAKNNIQSIEPISFDEPIDEELPF